MLLLNLEGVAMRLPGRSETRSIFKPHLPHRVVVTTK